jgi:hypothetical protein
MIIKMTSPAEIVMSLEMSQFLTNTFLLAICTTVNKLTNANQSGNYL